MDFDRQEPEKRPPLALRANRPWKAWLPAIVACLIPIHGWAHWQGGLDRPAKWRFFASAGTAILIAWLLATGFLVDVLVGTIIAGAPWLFLVGFLAVAVSHVIWSVSGILVARRIHGQLRTLGP